MLDIATIMLKLIIVYLIVAAIGSLGIISCQDLPLAYNVTATTACSTSRNQMDSIKQDIKLILKNSVLPSLNHTENIGPGYGACGCGGSEWTRAAYLDMSDPTQTCPPAWELITTPRRSCGRPSSAVGRTCDSAIFPNQGTQYVQVCGQIKGYQVGQPGAFYLENTGNPQTIDGPYVDGVSLTYGNPRQHIWTFAAELDEGLGDAHHYCPCTMSSFHSQDAITIPSFVGSNYFCETGVPPGQTWSSTFYADDPLWDGLGCGPTSTCCTFNNPPWFCKQLPQSTNADLEVRLCSVDSTNYENIPIELIEIYIK